MTPADTKKSRAARTLGVIALALGIFQAVQLYRLIDRYAVDVPFWDQWDIYNAFFEPHGLWETFSWLHGPHRQGAGSFIMQAVNAATGWNQRAQAFAIAAVMAAAAAAFLWLKRRLFTSLRWYDAIPALMILSLKPAEIYFAALNVSHAALPLLLIILLCIALTIDSALLRTCAVPALFFLTLFTGFGLLAAPVVPVLPAAACLHHVRKGHGRQALYEAVALVLCLAAIAGFCHQYRFAPSVDCFQFPDERWYLYPVFMAVMFSAAILPDRLLTLPSILIGLSIITVLLCMLSAACVQLRRHGSRHPLYRIMFILIAFSLVFSAATAAGRICLGLQAATASRYIPLIMPGFLGAYLFFLSIPAIGKSRIVMPALFAAAVCLLLTGWPWQRYHCALHFHNVKHSWAQAFRQTNDIGLADALSGQRVHPDPERTALARKLEWLRRNGYSLFSGSAAAGAPAAAGRRIAEPHGQPPTPRNGPAQ